MAIYEDRIEQFVGIRNLMDKSANIEREPLKYPTTDSEAMIVLERLIEEDEEDAVDGRRVAQANTAINSMVHTQLNDKFNLPRKGEQT